MRLSKRICILLILLLPGIYLFVEYSGYLFLDKERHKHVVENIQISPELPERFYHLYNKVYPNSLKETPWGYYYRRFLKSGRNECPYQLAAYRSGYTGGKMIIAAFHLSHFIRTEEALNYVMDNNDFGSNIQSVLLRR